jgi:hypothetical protein
MNAITLKEAIEKGALKFKPWLKSFSPERFEVSFSDIIQGRGASEYLDPESFFKATFLTRRMEDVIKWCIARTHAKNNKGTIHLATGFGGGKSHLLGLLYHIFTSRTVPDSQILAELAKKEVPEVELIALDGHNLKYPIRNLPEIKEILRETKEDTITALETQDKPVVILLDEFVVYLAKLDSSKQKQEMAHLHTLISAINATSNSVLVIANPEGAAAYAKEVDTIKATLKEFVDAASDMSSIIGRVTQPIAPVEIDDFPSILKVRLTESVDGSVAKAVENHVGRLTDLDCKGYYPFHPLLVDVLYSRVSLFPDFQQTRDALKVVALTIKGILTNEKKAEFYMISPATLMFSDSDLRNILTNAQVFGYNLSQAVTEDVTKAAKKADDGENFGRFGRLASAVYLYSLHPEPGKRGISPEQAFHCMSDVRSVEDMAKMLGKFYSQHSTFMWTEGGRYLFKSDQNIPNLIRIKAQQVLDKEVEQYIKITLFDTVFGKTSDAYCTFHTTESFSPVHNTINVIVPFHWEDLEKIIEEKLSITSKRKNSIVILIPDKDMRGNVVQFSRQAIAAEKVRKEVRDNKKLFDEAKKQLRDNEARVQQIFRGMYTMIQYLFGPDVKETKSQPMRGNTIRDAILTRLREINKLVDIENIVPEKYLKSLLGKRDEVQVRELFDNIEDMTVLPFAYRPDAKEIIKEGVYEGAIGLVKGSIPAPLTEDVQLFYGPEMLSEVNDGDTVTTAERAKQLKKELADLQKGGEEPPPEDNGNGPVEEEDDIEKKDAFTADASGIATELGKRMSVILMKGLEARATLRFEGSIKGTLTAKNVRELRAIQDIAEGLAKATLVLGEVKAYMTIYTRE